MCYQEPPFPRSTLSSLAVHRLTASPRLRDPSSHPYASTIALPPIHINAQDALQRALGTATGTPVAPAAPPPTVQSPPQPTAQQPPAPAAQSPANPPAPVSAPAPSPGKYYDYPMPHSLPRSEPVRRAAGHASGDGVQQRRCEVRNRCGVSVE